MSLMPSSVSTVSVMSRTETSGFLVSAIAICTSSLASIVYLLRLLGLNVDYLNPNQLIASEVEINQHVRVLMDRDGVGDSLTL